MAHLNRRFTVPLAVLAPLLLLSALPASFCLWDRDTLKAEAAGAPGVAEAIAGHFDRYPDLYYEMRIERVARELEQDPKDLALYDDAAVAVERLGRSSEAIEWMTRKRAVLDEQGEAADPHHEYTYLANLGTFHIHRWLHAGAPRESLTDLERGRDLLKEALELNPDAHFGRERWQLMAVEYLIEGPGAGGFKTLLPLKAAPYLSSETLKSKGLEDAVEGLTGLITLGSAWESIDILRALEWALVDRGDGHLGKFASLRLAELQGAGRRSLVLDAEDVALFSVHYDHFVHKPDLDSIEAFYPKARAAADARREKRNAFLLERLAQGEHPDTDPNFWKGWKGKPAPKLEVGSAGLASWSQRNPTWPIDALLVVVGGLLLWFTARWFRRRRLQGVRA